MDIFPNLSQSFAVSYQKNFHRNMWQISGQYFSKKKIFDIYHQVLSRYAALINKNLWGLPVGFLNTSTNPSKNQRVFFQNPTGEFNLYVAMLDFFTRTCIDGFKKPVPVSMGLKKTVLKSTGLKNPSM